MTMWGADVDALDALARRLIATAEQLNTARMTTRALLNGAGWFGHDADTFRQQWEGPHTAAFHAAVASLGSAADMVKHDAAEQRRASGDEGGSGAALAAAALLVAGVSIGGSGGSTTGDEPGPWIDGKHWYEPWTWGRDKSPLVDSSLQVSSQPLFDGSPKPGDVYQGDLGDCYLAASAAAVANANPEMIRKMITDNRDGTYTVSFHNSNGGVDKVIVDGKFYTINGVTAYGHPSQDQWYPIVEKAYAKWKGDYSSIGNGGNSTDSLAAFTGYQAHSSQLGGFLGMSDGDAWKQVQQSINSHHPITASTDGSIQSSNQPYSLVGDHVYSVIGYKTHADGSQWVTVRNPWGTKPGNDGVGDISIDDFRKYFSNLQWTS